MASLLTRKLVLLSNPSTSSHHHYVTILNPLFHFSTQIRRKEDVSFMARYLISSFGFAENRAIKVASDRHFSPIKTPDRPESVVCFLKDTGLNDVQIKKAISLAPQLLCANVSKTLEPAANEVIAAGFTRKTLIQLMQYNPQVLTHTNLISGLQFWRNFVGNEEAFLKLTKKWGIFCLNIDKKAIPGINLLREYSLSDNQIVILLMKSGNFLLRSLDSIKSNIERIEKLGFPRGSKMFLVGLGVVSSMKKDTFDKKVAFFKMTYGWSQEDINLAFKKYPNLLSYSQENVSSTMDFLIEKVALNPRSIVVWPSLLGRSLERTIIPRHYVLTVLKSKGVEIKWNIFTVFTWSEKKFIEKCILPHKELPDLEEAYAAASAGRMPLS